MKRMKEILTKPRGIYYSFIAMLTITMFLAKISFSYYVDESKIDLPIKPIDNLLFIDDNTNNLVVLEGNETREITLTIKSDYETKTKYAIYYEENENITIEVLSNDDEYIESNATETIKLKLINNSEQEEMIEFNIESGFINNNIDVQGTIINKG